MVHSSVSIDQYSGQVLQVRNFLTDSRGYLVIRFNRSIHTGDVWGTPGHVIVSLSSLALAVMAMTGVVIWWKKLARWSLRKPGSASARFYPAISPAAIRPATAVTSCSMARSLS